MRMIPGQPLDTKSRAELRVFDQLRASFPGADQTGWFSMHSLNLPRHEYKRFGEIDFIVCGPDGLFVLEVKGGGVSCRDGVWETCNRYGEVERLRESPFRQAEGALHGLCERLPTDLAKAFVIGYGVVMPDVSGLPASAEWDRAVLADARSCREFQRWLDKLIAHWRGKDPRKPRASPEQLRALQQYLRPDFEAVMPLHSSAHEVETRIARLTEDQLRFVDVVEANQRVICTGGAGTGKTMLALELAKRWSAADMKVALACHSPWLKTHLERSAGPGVTVSLADSLRITARRFGVSKFDALIVDEGQDLLSMEALDRLDEVVRGGLGDGRWSFFHDSNNQSGLCGEFVPDAYTYLESFGPVRIPLKTNCRNSLPILNRIQGALGADLGTSGVGDGPAVREVTVDNVHEAASALRDELGRLLNVEGFSPSDIVILSPNAYGGSCVASLQHDPGLIVAKLDEFSPHSARNAMGFAQIENYKGLESPVVVLVDLPAPGRSSSMRALHYVGMSRARVLLSIICC